MGGRVSTRASKPWRSINFRALPGVDRRLLREGGYMPPEERQERVRREREKNAARVKHIASQRTTHDCAT